MEQTRIVDKEKKVLQLFQHLPWLKAAVFQEPIVTVCMLSFDLRQQFQLPDSPRPVFLFTLSESQMRLLNAEGCSGPVLSEVICHWYTVLQSVGVSMGVSSWLHSKAVSVFVL